MKKYIFFLAILSVTFSILYYKLNSPNHNTQIDTWNKNLISNVKSGGKGIKVAVIDSGINVEHEDLDGVVTKRYNAIDPNQKITDDFGHGTAIAGIIAAQDNNIGIVGIAPEVEIYDIKVLDENGVGEVDDLIEALDYSMKNNVDIVNISFGFQLNDKKLKEKVKEVSQNNIIIIAASGNSYGLKGDYPANYTEVFSKGSINKDLKRSKFSSKGNIDFVQPGEDILSTNNTGDYSHFSGTSFAAAHTTGVISLLLSENTTLSLTEEFIISFENWKNASYGKGLLTLRKKEFINEHKKYNN